MKNSCNTIAAEAAGYLMAEAEVLAPASTPGTRIAIAATLLRKLPVAGHDIHCGFRLRLEDEILSTAAER